MDKAAREKARELCDFSPILMPAFCVAVLINLTKQALCALDAAEAESAGLRDGTALEYTAVLQDSLENAVTDLKDARATNARLGARVSELEASTVVFGDLIDCCIALDERGFTQATWRMFKQALDKSRAAHRQ